MSVSQQLGSPYTAYANAYSSSAGQTIQCGVVQALGNGFPQSASVLRVDEGLGTGLATTSGLAIQVVNATGGGLTEGIITATQYANAAASGGQGTACGNIFQIPKPVSPPTAASNILNLTGLGQSGTGIIAATTTSVLVPHIGVTVGAIILVSWFPTASGTGSAAPLGWLYAGAINPGTGFTVSTDTAAAANGCQFAYFVVKA